MSLFIGDSNVRQVIEENHSCLDAYFNEDVTFEQAGTNEALEAILEGISDTSYNRIIICTILNEVAAKCKTAKTRDENIDAITKKQVEIVQAFAQVREDVQIIVVGPMIRFDPVWINDKIRLVSLSLKDHVENTGMANISFSEGCKLTEFDLAHDKVHLSEAGKEKFIRHLSEAASKSQTGARGSPTMNWTQTPTPTPTPASQRFNLRSQKKRVRNASSSDGEVVVKKKGKTTDLDAIMSKLNSMTQQMNEERAATIEKTEEIVAKLNINIQTTSNHAKKFEMIEKKFESSNLTIATMKEDLDAAENEKQKDIVLVRRLKSAVPIPTKKTELNETLKDIATELMNDLGVPEEEQKFVALAYSNLDQKKQATRTGTVPAFKIGFKTKEMAIKFKEAGAKASKDKESRVYKVGFTHQQCSGSRIRSAVMWAIVNKLKAEGKEAWVNSASNKPKLQIKTNEKFPKDYTYIEAVKEFGSKLEHADIKELNDQARKFFKGQCEQIFLILKD